MPRVLFSIVFALPLTVFAVEPYTCRNGAFPSYAEFSLAKIVASPGERVHFQWDDDHCPGKPECIGKAYLVDGDDVVVAQSEDGWSCIFFKGKKYDYAGWVPESNIKALPAPVEPVLTDWVGTWTDGDNRISIAIKSEGDTLAVHGSAIWDGGEGKLDPIINTGSVEGVARPAKDRLMVSQGDEEYSCIVNLRLVGTYLMATDNFQCGGRNVRFDGVYRLKK